MDEQQTYTLQDARREKLASTAELDARIDERTRSEADIAAVLRDHPQIGVLCRAGKPVYYVNWPSYAEAKNPRDLIATQAVRP